jgi:hypothetical protein
MTAFVYHSGAPVFGAPVFLTSQGWIILEEYEKN